MRRALILLVLPLAALTMSSCGGGGNKQLSRSEFEQQLGAILRPLQNTTLPKALAISPAKPRAAVRGLKEVERTLQDAASKLSAMRPPNDAAGPTSELASAIRQIARRLTAARRDAEHGNFLRLEEFKAQLASDPAVGRIRDVVLQLVNLGYTGFAGG